MAADFFTIEAWTRSGLQRFVILFFIELSTRKVQIGWYRLEREWIVDEPDRA